MNKLVLLLKIICNTLLLVLLAVLTWQVVSRYVFNDPSTITEELSRLLLVWLGILGTSLTFILRRHMFFEKMLETGSPTSRRRTRIFSDANVFIYGLLTVVGGGAVVYEVWEMGQKTAVMGVPTAYVYLVLPVSGLIAMLSTFSPWIEKEAGGDSCN